MAPGSIAGPGAFPLVLPPPSSQAGSSSGETERTCPPHRDNSSENLASAPSAHGVRPRWHQEATRSRSVDLGDDLIARHVGHQDAIEKRR